MGMLALEDCFFSTSFQYLPTGYTDQLLASRAATKTFHTSSAGIGELERMVIFPATRSGRMKLRWVNWLTNWMTSVRSRLSKDITTVRAPVRMSFRSTGAFDGGRLGQGLAAALELDLDAIRVAQLLVDLQRLVRTVHLVAVDAPDHVAVLHADLGVERIGHDGEQLEPVRHAVLERR